MKPENDTFRQRVFQILAAIPYGHVATYGDVAHLSGSPKAARQVGGLLKRLPINSSLPWFRVINRYGEISLTGEDYLRQKKHYLLKALFFLRQGKLIYCVIVGNTDI